MSMKTSFRLSRLNLLLVVATALGVGTIWAFGIFYSAWKTQCNALLLESEITFHKAESDAKKQYHAAMAQLEVCRGEAAAVTKQGGSSSASKSIEAMRELTKVSNALQKRQRAQCMQYYGPGPYVVQFSLAVPEIENIVLRLEFPNVDIMPHTTYTFLELVRHRFYSGTTIGLAGSDTSYFIGGNPNESSTWVKSSLTKKYNEYGYESTPFMIKEGISASKATKCVEGSFGILDDGPEFALFLEKPSRGGSTSSSGGADLPLSCPGRIVQGYDQLDELRDILQRTRVTIIEARVIDVSKEDEALRREHQDEL